MPNELLKNMAESIKKAKKDFEELDTYIKVMAEAGEDVSKFQAAQSDLKNRIDKWERALKGKV